MEVKSTPGLHWTSPDLPGLLLVFVEIMPDKVIAIFGLL